MHQILSIVKISFLCLSFLLFSGSISLVEANQTSYITIVNPVRISEYTKNPGESIKAEYLEIQKRNFPATWLLTYDVISNSELVSVFKTMDQKQEFGVFLEVTQNFSNAAKVAYNKTGSWHYANSLFLSGYTQEDRIKLIDISFKKFKEQFGYFPKSVGGWWVDSYSLSYMQKKYGIIGVLGVSDQYDLDGYKVWGTYWSTPYYPNKINSALPASSIKSKLDVVTFRWALRDPLNGYRSPNVFMQPSLYSIQDYSRIGESHDYFEKLVRVYTNNNLGNKFSHATIGLEADFSPDFYKGLYSVWLDSVIELGNEGVVVSSMQEFASFYRKTFNEISPSHLIVSDDLLGTNSIALWYQNPKYRIGLVYDRQTLDSEIVDFRIYPTNFIEPFYKQPNKQFSLSINLPFILDTVIDKKHRWRFNVGRIMQMSNERVIFEKGEINFNDDNLSVSGINIPSFVISSKQLASVNVHGKIMLSPRSDYFVGKDGLFVREVSIDIPFVLESKIQRYRIFIAFFTIASIFIFKLLFDKKRNVFKSLITGLSVFLAFYLLLQSQKYYYVSQTEVDALSVLARLPEGKVLVYDKDCLRCVFENEKPAAAAGKKNYVGQISGHQTIANLSFILAENSHIAKQILAGNAIKYVYLTRYESYIEHLPYNSDELGLVKIYENGNSEIWEVL